MEFEVLGYSVSRGSYEASVNLGAFGFRLSIGAPTAVILFSENAFIDPGSPEATSLTIGDDEQGELESLEYRSFIRDTDGQTTYSFIRLAAANTAEYILLPVDPETGALTDGLLPQASDYASNSTFDPVAVILRGDDPPIAADDTAETEEDRPLTIDVLANDSDGEDDPLTITEVETPTNGTTAIVQGGILYTPDPNFSGEEQFSYTISDGERTSSATVTVTVNARTGGPTLVQGGDEDERFTASAALEIFALGGGSDRTEGLVNNFFGDTFQNFDLDDSIVILDEIQRRNFVVASNPTTIQVDTDGNGLADGSIIFEGDFSGGDFMAVVQEMQTLVTFETFLPMLLDQQKVQTDLITGIINQEFLTGNGRQDIEVALQSNGSDWFAGYDNVIGAYEVTPSGDIVDTRILFENANSDKTARTILSGVEEGHRIGFFLIQDAAEWFSNQGLSPQLSFVGPSGQTANIDDGAGIKLLVNGLSADQVVFHSFDPALNIDGVQHVLSGVDPGGDSLRIGFEDLLGGGDRDYEDVVMKISFVDAVIS